jgi:hypothetical protein
MKWSKSRQGGGGGGGGGGVYLSSLHCKSDIKEG